MQKSVISNYNLFIRYPCFINLLPTILPLLDPAAITWACAWPGCWVKDTNVQLLTLSLHLQGISRDFQFGGWGTDIAIFAAHSSSCWTQPGSAWVEMEHSRDQSVRRKCALLWRRWSRSFRAWETCTFSSRCSWCSTGWEEGWSGDCSFRWGGEAGTWRILLHS